MRPARGDGTRIVAPVTTTIKGLSSEALVGSDDGLHHDCVIALDNVITGPDLELPLLA